MKRFALFLALLAQSSGLPPESAVKPIRVAEVFGYSEGIVFDAQGYAYVSLLHRNQVLRFRPGGTPAVWATIDEPNGHRILPDGSHLIAAKGAVLHLDSTGRVIARFADRYGDQPLRNPNDLALDGEGGVYFTDPGPDDDPVGGSGKVYYAHAGQPLRLVATDFCFVNGILVRPDGHTLLVDDSCSSRVFAFDIVRNGEVSGRRIFAVLPDSGRGALDGMAVDEQGRLYIAHYAVGRIEVVDSAGRLLRRYATGSAFSSNVAFGGPRLDQLFVTGAANEKAGPGDVMRLTLAGVRGRDSRALPAPRVTRAAPNEP
jgi:gluconolactonase